MPSGNNKKRKKTAKLTFGDVSTAQVEEIRSETAALTSVALVVVGNVRPDQVGRVLKRMGANALLTGRLKGAQSTWDQTVTNTVSLFADDGPTSCSDVLSRLLPDRLVPEKVIVFLFFSPYLISLFFV